MQNQNLLDDGLNWKRLNNKVNIKGHNRYKYDYKTSTYYLFLLRGELKLNIAPDGVEFGCSPSAPLFGSHRFYYVPHWNDK